MRTNRTGSHAPGFNRYPHEHLVEVDVLQQVQIATLRVE